MCDIDLNVEITPLPNLNTNVKDIIKIHGVIIIVNQILFNI